MTPPGTGRPGLMRGVAPMYLIVKQKPG